MASIDWQRIFVPSGSVAEIIIRGSLMYLAILGLFRLSRRNTGSLSMSDLLVVVLIADAAQNGMAAEYRSLTEGLILVGTIVAWSHTLDWLAYRSRFVSWLLHPPPLLLISNGHVQQRNLRLELITRADLLEQLREQGVAQVSDVEQCWLESDGRLSVIQRKPEQQARRGRELRS